MNILLDFLTFKWRTGAGEYARRVYYALMEKIQTDAISDVRLFALYDSSEGIAYEDMSEGHSQTAGISYLDANTTSITQLVEDNNIDLLFIACGQYLGKYGDLENVRCKTICVIHDLAYEEMFANSMDYYFKLINPKYRLNEHEKLSTKYHINTLKLVKWFVKTRCKQGFETGYKLLLPTLGLIQNNPNTQLITVSNYTRNSLLYHYGISPNKVKVLYSPERVYYNLSEKVENADLADLISKKKKYYLMLSANRNSKNPYKAVRAFKRYSEIDKEAYFILVGYPSKLFEKMLNPSSLSDSDLALAIQHCYALVYPTFFEGFGYPAIEAMHYAKPVLASNVTSLPEVFEDVPIYFSPLYETEIFNALIKLTDENYIGLCQKSAAQYEKVKKRQEQDLEQLINMILSKHQ